MVNEFYRDLQYGNKNTEVFDRFYNQYFEKKITSITTARLPTQLRGIDKIINFEDCSFVYVEEKTRRKDYGDLLIERYSSKNSDGWIMTSTADYLAYFVEPSRKMGMLKMQALQAVWREHEDDWTKKYFKIEARNPTYTSISYGIPLEEIARYTGVFQQRI